MKIDFGNKQNFTGYDARKLKGLFVTDRICAEQLRRITNGTGIDIFTPEIASKSIRKEYAQLMNNDNTLWAQDYFTFSIDKVIFDGSRDFIKRVLRASADGIQKRLGFTPFKSETHIRGGNYFICDVGGERKVLLSDNKMAQQNHIYPIPELDYHLDLYTRPLDKGRVLVADNQTTIDSLNGLSKAFERYIRENNLSKSETQTYKTIIDNIKMALKCFDATEQFDKRKPRETLPKVIEALENYGFEPIKVPANYYYLKGVKDPERAKQMMKNFENNMNFIVEESKKNSPKAYAMAKEFVAIERFKTRQDKTIGVELENFYLNNFLNAIVYKDENDVIHYITNAPLLDKELGITPEIEAKTGLSTKNLFIDSISPYVKRENIHFINEQLTERLFKYMGGIHCTAAEIPA